MNEPRLDDAAKTLATASRRRTLRAAGAVLAVGLARLCPAPARAGHFGCQHLGARCADATQCCSGICKRKRGTNRKTCRAHGKGICKAGQDSCAQPGAYPCGSNFCGGKNGCVVWTRDTDCVTQHNFPAGSACVACPGCTATGGTRCVAPCPSPD